MAKPYSMDLRERAMRRVSAGESAHSVAAVLKGQIGFDDIPKVIEQVLSATKSRTLTSISQVLEVDSQARKLAQDKVGTVVQNAASLRPV